jgi:putative membrane protein insertion efficiency factor
MKRFHWGKFVWNVPRLALIALVRFYQIVLSPIKFAILGPASRCRFEPSCSQYALEAFQRHGVFGGAWLAAKRLLRCHPWGAFGPDPVPAPRTASHRTCC